jgi:hypothetical protein
MKLAKMKPGLTFKISTIKNYSTYLLNSKSNFISRKQCSIWTVNRKNNLPFQSTRMKMKDLKTNPSVNRWLTCNSKWRWRDTNRKLKANLIIQLSIRDTLSLSSQTRAAEIHLFKRNNLMEKLTFTPLKDRLMRMYSPFQKTRTQKSQLPTLNLRQIHQFWIRLILSTAEVLTDKPPVFNLNQTIRNTLTRQLLVTLLSLKKFNNGCKTKWRVLLKDRLLSLHLKLLEHPSKKNNRCT